MCDWSLVDIDETSLVAGSAAQLNITGHLGNIHLQRKLPKAKTGAQLLLRLCHITLAHGRSLIYFIPNSHLHRTTISCPPTWIYRKYTVYSCFVNSLAPGRCGCNFESAIFEHMSRVKFISTFSKIVLRWMPQNICDDKSTLVQVMARCREATSHYLNQRPRSVSSNGITKPQGVKTIMHAMNNLK